MIKSIELTNYGPIDRLALDQLGKINLMIGPNRSGKTILLKALYCTQRTIEMTDRGKYNLPIKDTLANKLHWIFQVEKLGNIVRRPESGPLYFKLKESDGSEFYYSFGTDTENKIIRAENTCKPRNTNSVFIPAKEVFSLLDIIKSYREIRMDFGFDETYYDLAIALTPPTQGKIAQALTDVRLKLERAIDGKIEYSKEKKHWQYLQGRQSFDIYSTSEGTKKIAILDTLIANHFLSRDSVVFIDEPESGLHPGVLVELLDIVAALAKYGMQFFIASHSYFVIKKLYLLAQSEKMSIPVIAFDNAGHNSVSNLLEGMPENSIIDESLKLYEQELCL